jgi:pilus assembly protein Flp/PilA
VLELGWDREVVMIVKLKRETIGAFKSAKSLSQRFAADQTGATAIEYSLLAAMIAVACISAFRQLGTTDSGVWFEVSSKVITAMK